MRPSSRRSRRTAAVVVIGLLTAGVTAALPGAPALAVGTVTVVQPANATVANGADRTITFQTSDSWFPLQARGLSPADVARLKAWGLQAIPPSGHP